MTKENCWEVKNCGREVRGKNTEKLGICPAATETRTNGINHGDNGGRACWAIAGTLCGGIVQGSFASKVKSCLHCEFYLQVKDEETGTYQCSTDILAIIKEKTKYNPCDV